MKTSSCSIFRNAKHGSQDGVALVIALILLVVATLIGIAGISGTALQERMSSNLYDRSLAMQSAESAIRAAQAAISADPDVGIDCRTTLCPMIPTDTFSGNSATWIDVTGQFLINTGLTLGTPQYHIQLLATEDDEDALGLGQSANERQYGAGGGAPQANHYRVTVRSRAPNVGGDRAIVVLQSTIRRSL